MGATIAVALSGVSGPDPARRVTFSNNRIDGGTLFSTDVHQLSVLDNVFTGDALARPVIHVQRGGDTLRISGNTIGGTANAAILVSEVNTRPVDRALISGNMCEVTAGSGIRVDSSEDVAVTDNLLVASGAAGRALMVSGAGALGGGRVLTGEVLPEGVVPGLIGDVYQRIGTAAGPRLFVKESAAKPETGWVAK